MSNCAVDHLVVAAASLEQGAAWCEATLGVACNPGGKHPLMGTHNRLLAIGSEAFPNAYLEIIAIDPEAPAPGRARWFGLDDAALQRSLATDGPRLVHWVARSTMLDMHRWGLMNVGHQPGDPIAASRETPHGLLAWQILVRDDGRTLCEGALPTLIQWQGVHPAERMPASGVQLASLAVAGVPARAKDVLRVRGVAMTAERGEGEAVIRATLQTPRGEITLESP